LSAAERASAAEDDDEQLSDEEKSVKIKALVNRMKRDHPGWSFDRCWTQLRSEQPDLFAESD
jgi:hypothetical protein